MHSGVYKKQKAAAAAAGTPPKTRDTSRWLVGWSVNVSMHGSAGRGVGGGKFLIPGTSYGTCLLRQEVRWFLGRQAVLACAKHRVSFQPCVARASNILNIVYTYCLFGGRRAKGVFNFRGRYDAHEDAHETTAPMRDFCLGFFQGHLSRPPSPPFGGGMMRHHTHTHTKNIQGPETKQDDV